MSAVADLIAGGPAALASARREDLNLLSAAELVELGRLAAEIVREAQALQLDITAAASAKDAHKSAGTGSMVSMIAEQCGTSRREASGQIKLADALVTKAPATREAMGVPGMSTAKAHIIADALEKLSPLVSAQEQAAIEADLAAAAPGLAVEQLSRKAKRALEVIDVRRADERENRELERAEADQRQQSVFWMSRPDDRGMVKGGFEIDALSADMLRSVLDSKTSPRGLDAEQMHRNPLQKNGEAFVDIVRHLPKDGYGNHGGVAATLLVTVTEDSLRARTDAAGTTEHGTRVSAGELRQIACNAGILPAVMNGKSQILDLGRERRLHSAAQRIALAHRDQGCAFPGCDRPPGWCEAHHVTPWSEGGDTTVDDGVLLCGFHHRHIHNSQWQVVMGRDGLPEFIAPAHLDAERRPQRNTRYRPLVA